MFRKFKEKWKIKSNLQLVIILIVFSVTGSAALVVRKFVFQSYSVYNLKLHCSLKFHFTF